MPAFLVVVMDEKVRKIISNELAKGYLLNKKGLDQLKLAIVKGTGEFKFLSYTNLKKWVSEVRKKKQATSDSKQYADKHSKSEEETVEIVEATPQDFIIPEPRPFEVVQQAPLVQTGNLVEKMNRVQIQNILFEMNYIRQTLTRLSKRLDSIQELLQKQE